MHQQHLHHQPNLITYDAAGSKCQVTWLAPPETTVLAPGWAWTLARSRAGRWLLRRLGFTYMRVTS